jgi:hypothetical protein
VARQCGIDEILVGTVILPSERHAENDACTKWDIQWPSFLEEKNNKQKILKKLETFFCPQLALLFARSKI